MSIRYNSREGRNCAMEDMIYILLRPSVITLGYSVLAARVSPRGTRRFEPARSSPHRIIAK